MDPHAYTRSELKGFADRVLKRIERDQAPLNYQKILESIAAGFGVRDWNTLSAMLRDKPVPARELPPDGDGPGDEAFRWTWSSGQGIVPVRNRVGPVLPFHGNGPRNTTELVIAPTGFGKSTLVNGSRS